MANYTNTLKPIADLWIENNIAKTDELKTWITAIEDGKHIGLEHYRDKYGVFFKLALVTDEYPAIQDYITFSSDPKLFQRYIVNYIQTRYGIIKSTQK